MPELPDIELYREVLTRRVVGGTLDRVRVKGPFLVRSFDPPIDEAVGRQVREIRRLGKRLVFAFEGELFFVLHLMIAGRLLYKPPGAVPTGKIDLAALEFGGAAPVPGTLVITEAGTKHRASLHVVQGEAALAAHDPGGLDVFAASDAAFVAALRRDNRTLKRALAEPQRFSGIGNAYSDEILWEAGMSPITLTGRLSDEDAARLAQAARRTLEMWTRALLGEFGVIGTKPGRFPKAGDITAFRPDFAVHGKFGQACPRCGHLVQRIVHAENETNYCPVCQTGGRVLADRSLSRLLKEDWPRTPEEWEMGRGPARG